MESQIHYFMRAHTANGPVQLVEKNIDDIRIIYALRGNTREKQVFYTVCKSILKDMKNIEWLIHAEIPTMFEGVIMRDQSIAIIDENMRSFIQTPVITIDLGSQNDHYMSLLKEIYIHLQDAQKIHFKLENLYLEYMDFHKANDVISTLIQQLEDQCISGEEKPVCYERFFGSFTLHGPQNMVEKLIKPMKKVYHLKGKQGTGKSYTLKKVIEFCERNHISHEIYYCSFDPLSVDMVIIRPHQICLFDSTKPHAFHPATDKECIIDMYEKTVDPSVVTIHKDEIETYNEKYEEKIRYVRNVSAHLWKQVHLSEISIEKESVIEEIASKLLNKHS